MKNYTKIISPIVNKRINEYRIYTKRIRNNSMKSNSIEALDRNEFDLLISSVYSFYAKVDISLATEVIFSFQALVQYLNSICAHSSASTEPFLKLIFSSLKDATNLRSEEYEKYFTFFPSKDDNGYLSILVEKCRQKVRLLPSFDIIRDYLATYLSLFIDLQVTKYSSDDETDKQINLRSWSCAHGQKYHDISSWEYCMSIDSTLSLQFLLASATNPDLTEQEVECSYNAIFPWICGIQKILEGYLNYNDDLFSRSVNYIFQNKNLKEYEDRIIYFINRAAQCSVSHPDYYLSTLKILISIYITQPKAKDGMNKLTSKALLQAGGRGMFLYSSTVKLIQAKRLSNQI
jgi:tetraprenyl-beta-curcumene synthase